MVYKILKNEYKYRKCTKILRRAILLNGFFFFASIVADKERGIPMTDIIYMDIDGTLRDEKYGIPESARKAVEKCMEKGIFIVICTGRNRGSIQEDVKNLNADGIISGGGCDIRFRGRVLRQEYFKVRLLGEFLEVIRKKRLGAVLEAEREIYMNEKAALFYREDFRKKAAGAPDPEKMRQENKIRYEDNFLQLWRDSGRIHKICLIGNADHISHVEKKFSKDIEIVQKKEWNRQCYIEILPRGCGKGAAVKFMNRYLKIAKEDSMSFGDGDNDVEMLRAAGTGIAVRGCSGNLLKYADSLCSPPMEDGIYRELVRRKIIEVEERRV